MNSSDGYVTEIPDSTTPLWSRVYDIYYPAGASTRQNSLRTLLETHSRMVASFAIELADSLGLDIDRRFVEEAAMLHDIGIFRCNAPSIFCDGYLPYIAHGVEGRRLLDSLGLPRHALVCERHTGSGLTLEDIRRQQLPLPLRDMTPQSAEERLICYADKFYSKSGDPRRRKPLDEVEQSIARHGADALARFRNLLPRN